MIRHTARAASVFVAFGLSACTSPIPSLSASAHVPSAAPPDSTGEAANHYDLAVTLDPSTAQMEVEGQLTVVADGALDSLTFLLNGGLRVSRLTGDAVAGWSTVKGTAVGTVQLPATQALTVRFSPALAAGDATTLRVAYEGRIDNASIEVGRGVVSVPWTELSVGALWYPAAFSEPAVTSHIDLKLPSQYDVIAPGRIQSLGGGRWVLDNDRSSPMRVTLAASDRWHVSARAFSDTHGATVYAARQTPRVDRALDAATEAFDAYSGLYGPPRRPSLDLVVLYPNAELGLQAPNEAYSTGNLIAIRDDADEAAWRETIRHEIAHMWWSAGQPGTPDEFLSESLAEYSSIVASASFQGSDWLARRRTALTDRSVAIDGSLLDIDGFTGARQPLLYARGPAALWALHDRIGADAMANLLAEVQVQGTDTILAFFERIAEREGEETASWFTTLL